MPIVSVNAMRQALLPRRQSQLQRRCLLVEADELEVFETTTPNASVRYVYFNFNTKEGPVVVEIPPAVEAGSFGTLLDAWQVPLVDVGPAGEDQGKGGKYLLLPPDFKGDAPTGYFIVRPQTYNGYALFRAIPKTSSETDVRNAIALAKNLHAYSLEKADHPPEQRFVDMADKLFDGIVRFDESFYANLAQMINEEPVLTRDRAMMGLMLPLGIEKGKEFKPDTATQRLLANSVREAHEWLMNGLLTYATPHWPDSRWALPTLPVGPETAFSFERPNYLDVDARGIGYFTWYAPPKKLGAATDYLATFTDAKGDRSRGGNVQAARAARCAGKAVLGLDTLRPRNVRLHSRGAPPRCGFLRPENAEERRRLGGYLHGSEAACGQGSKLDRDCVRPRLVSLFPLIRAGEGVLRQDVEAAGRRAGELKARKGKGS